MIIKLRGILKPSTLLLIFIILISAFFRFYNAPLKYSLAEDNSRDAIVALAGAQQFQLPLTGPFSSLGPFVFGPWYYYQLIVFQALTHFAYAPWIYMTLLSVGFVFVMYKIGELISDKKLGLIMAYLAAISPAQINSGSQLTNPNQLAIFAALTFWIFLMIIKQRLSNWWPFIWGLVIGIGINDHYQMVGLLILPLIAAIYKRKISVLVITCVGVVITFIPLLFFDLNNHWHNLTFILDYYRFGQYRIYFPNSWTLYLKNFWPGLWGNVLGVPIQFSLGIIFPSFGLMAVLLSRKRLPVSILLITIAFVGNFLMLRYYRGERTWSYLRFLNPYIFIFTGFLIWQLFKVRFGNIIVFIVLITITLLSFPAITEQFKINKDHLYFRQQVQNLEKQFPNEKFTFAHCQGSSQFTSQGMLVLLAYDNKLDPKGKIIHQSDQKCAKPIPMNLLSIYDNTVKWWYEEKP